MELENESDKPGVLNLFFKTTLVDLGMVMVD